MRFVSTVFLTGSTFILLEKVVLSRREVELPPNSWSVLQNKRRKYDTINGPEQDLRQENRDDTALYTEIENIDRRIGATVDELLKLHRAKAEMEWCALLHDAIIMLPGS